MLYTTSDGPKSRGVSHHTPSRWRHPLLMLSAILLAALLMWMVLFDASSTLADTDEVNSTTITLQPSAGTVDGCGTLQVEVHVNDVVDLYGADFRMSFDPAVLQVVDADPGRSGIQIEPLSDLLSLDWVIKKEADNTAGTIWYAVTQMNPTPPVSGSGALARITFRGLGGGSSALHFTYTKLATREGAQIPATAADGSASATPPPSPTLSIQRLNATDVRLSWSSVSDVAEYHLYRGTAPYFAPASPPYQTTTSLSYDDLGALGSLPTNYTYVVRSACTNGLESAISNRVGEYDYSLSSATSYNYCDIAMSLIMPTVTKASELAAYVGSSARRVSRYNAATQSFQTYVTGNPSTDYDLSLGEFLFLVTNDTAPATAALIGGIPDPDALTFALVSGSPPRYNYLSLPLDQDELTDASDVAGDIGTSVLRVSRYRTENQAYQIYLPGNPSTDFPLAVGEPFSVLLKDGAPTNWP